MIFVHAYQLTVPVLASLASEEGQGSWPKRWQSLLSFKLVPRESSPNLQKPTEKLPLLPWLHSVLQWSVDHSSPLSPEMTAWSITVIRSNAMMSTVSSHNSFSQQKEQQCQPQLKTQGLACIHTHTGAAHPPCVVCVGSNYQLSLLYVYVLRVVPSCHHRV